MKRWKHAFVAALVSVAVWACAGTPGPGDSGYPYNLSGSFDGDFLVEGMAFLTILEVETGAGGELRGTYRVTDPVEMEGEVNGSLVADTARFNLRYMNPMDGCGGTVEGSGAVEEGGTAFAGRLRVNDSCGGYLSGRFSFKK